MTLYPKDTFIFPPIHIPTDRFGEISVVYSRYSPSPEEEYPQGKADTYGIPSCPLNFDHAFLVLKKDSVRIFEQIMK